MLQTNPDRMQLMEGQMVLQTAMFFSSSKKSGGKRKRQVKRGSHCKLSRGWTVQKEAFISKRGRDFSQQFMSPSIRLPPSGLTESNETAHKDTQHPNEGADVSCRWLAPPQQPNTHRNCPDTRLLWQEGMSYQKNSFVLLFFFLKKETQFIENQKSQKRILPS